MTKQLKLQQPVTSGGLQNTNFFNGRLITGADMTREQTARRESVARLGQAVGEGIAEGLLVEVVQNAENYPIVGITPGRAINRHGEVLGLYEYATVNLVERISTVEQESTAFSRCSASAVTGTYAAGVGLYLLVLSPAFTKQGSAPTGGLKNSFAACSSDVILEAVQFRLLPVDSYLANEEIPDGDRMRNFIAYVCFGAFAAEEIYENPFGRKPKTYGLIDRMHQGNTLSKADVPLAIISWSGNGLEFVDMWSVRRRVTRSNDASDWTRLLSDRRTSETEAMIRQFADHIAGEEPEKKDFQDVEAIDFFDFLPPVGILPVAAPGAKAGFNLSRFFGRRFLEEISFIDGENIQPLMRAALARDPIDLGSNERVRLYFIRENFAAVQAGKLNQFAVVFAKENMPNFGTARFEFSEWNLSRFV
jgi:hypothetical protein